MLPGSWNLTETGPALTWPSPTGALAKTSARVHNRAPRTVVRFQDESSEYTATKGQTQVTLHLSTHYHAEFGEQLKLVGNVPELGDWDVVGAPSMQWTSDHYWVTDVELPSGTDVQFKVVLLSHHGVVWEPGTDRLLKAEAQAGNSAIAVRVAWGIPDVQVAAPAESEDTASGELASQLDSLSDQFDSLWDPTKTGLPADITSALEASPLPSVREPRQKHVTLEPEWAILGGEEQESKSENAAEIHVAEPIAITRESTAPTAKAPSKVSQGSADVTAEDQGTPQIPVEADKRLQLPLATASTAEIAKQSTGVVEEAVEPLVKPKINGLRAASKAAGYAAAGVAAAVVLSALAVDVTDAAIASAVVAAGATFLPSAVDSEGRKQAHKGKGGASPVLGALELGLKAQEMLKGVGAPSQEKAAEAETTVPEVEIQIAEKQIKSAADRLAVYVQAKAAEAERYATQFMPTEEDLFETSPTNYNQEPQGAEIYASNVVPARGFKREALLKALRKKERLADK